MISATPPETQTRPAAFSVRQPADSPRPQVDHPHSNFAQQLKLVLAFRFFREKRSALAMQPLRRPAQRKRPVSQSDLPAPVFCLRDRRRSIPSHDRSAIARFLCFCRPTHNHSAPFHLDRAHLSIFSCDSQRAFFRKCRRAARDRRSPQRSRRRGQTTRQRRTMSRTACAIEVVRFRPFQFTSFKDSTRRGSRTGKSDVFPTILR